MSENTISTENTVAAATENDAAVAENTQTTAQGKDWQYYEEKESHNVQESTTSEADVTAKAEEEKIKLTVYGQQVEVTAEEAKAAAQKGMAFARVKAQLADSRNNAHLKMLEDIARQQGKSLDDFVLAIATENVMDSLVKKYGSINDVPLEEMHRNIRKMNEMQRDVQTRAQNAARESWRTQLAEFIEDNPGIKNLPDEIIETAKRTGNLALAYSDYTAKQLKAQLEQTQLELDMLKAEKQSEKSATPSSQSSAAGGSYRDDKFYQMLRSTW